METTSRPLSILLICDGYPPVIGGSEVEAQRVSAGLIRRGHKVEVLCEGGPPMPAQRHWVDPSGVPVRILTQRAQGSWKHYVYAAEVAWALWRERRGYDVVYFLMQGLQLAAGLPVAHLAGKPIVMKFGGSGVIPMMRSSSHAGRLELDWLRKWSHRILVLNDGMVEEALAEGFERERITWMPNPVDVDTFRPESPDGMARWRREKGIPETACVTVYVGRLSHEKGLPELLRGFALAARTHPDAFLLLVGDGAQRGELEALARQLEIPERQIKFAGRVDIHQVPQWLSASDLFALTSPSEGFSCALLEAMAVGLASVVSDIPANLQLVEDTVHGLTVPWNDAQRTAEAFTRLFEDPETRRVMGHAARQRVIDNYSIDRVVARYETLFEEVLNRRPIG